jgi:hypothetical protein
MQGKFDIRISYHLLLALSDIAGIALLGVTTGSINAMTQGLQL